MQTKLQMPSANVLLLIAIKVKVKTHFAPSQYLYFTFYRKITLEMPVYLTSITTHIAGP